MLAYVLRRLAATVPVMGFVALFVFSLLHLSPGDPAAIMAGDLASPEDIRRIRERLGLDRPFLTQFATWLLAALQGDLGASIFTGLPVTTLIGQRVEPTAALTLCTTVVAVAVAVPMGVVAAWRAGGAVDRLAMALAIVGFSVPVFVVGYGLILVFSVWLGWLPVQGYRSLADGIGPFARHMVLPSLALGFSFMALIARMTRTATLEVLAQDYVRTARAKGLPEGTMLVRHALRNASVPIVTVIGLGVALLIGGVVVTETVFAIPGIGRLVVDAILRRDFPVIQGVTLLFSALYVLVNLLVDLSYTILDPRIRY